MSYSVQSHSNTVKQTLHRRNKIIIQHLHLLVCHFIFVQTTCAQSGGVMYSRSGEMMLGKGATSRTLTTKHTHILVSRKGVLSIPDTHLLSRHVAPSVFPRTDGFCRLGGHGTTITSRRVWQRGNKQLDKSSINHASLLCETCVCTCTHTAYEWVCVHARLFPVKSFADKITEDNFSSAAQDPVSDNMLFGHHGCVSRVFLEKQEPRRKFRKFNNITPSFQVTFSTKHAWT